MSLTLEWLNPILIAVVGYFLHRTLTRIEKRQEILGDRSHDHGNKITAILSDIEWLKRIDALEERLLRAAERKENGL